MTYEVVMSPGAREDFEEIVSFLASRSFCAAKKFKERFESLVDHLRAGTITHDTSPNPVFTRSDYKVHKFSPYVLVYYTEGNRLVISYIVHERRNYLRIGSDFLDGEV